MAHFLRTEPNRTHCRTEISHRARSARLLPLLAALLLAYPVAASAVPPLPVEISLGGDTAPDPAGFVFPTGLGEDIADIFLIVNGERLSVVGQFTLARDPLTGYTRLTLVPPRDFDVFGTTSFTLVIQTRNRASGALAETTLQADTVHDTQPDAVVDPYAQQLIARLRQRIAAGEITDAQAVAQFAATAEYYNLRPGQIDRLLGLVPGTARAAYDSYPNPYDWYAYYFDPRVAQSGEIPPTIGALRLVSSSDSELYLAWDISAPGGLRNLQFTLNGGATSADGHFAGLNAATAYAIEARAETWNRFLRAWQTVRQSASFSTQTYVPPPPTPVDHAPVVNAPTGTATDTTVTETNQISDADGLRNVTYYLYQNDGTTLVSSNATGAFTGLTGSTPYKMKTTAETYNPATAVWTLQTSPLGSITTAATPDTTPPVAIGETVTTPYNTPLNGITVLANDSDNSGTVLLGSITNPVGGTFTKNGNTIDFVPTTGFVGNATCTYQVKDPTGNISTAVLTVNVSAAPQVPPVMGDVPNQSGWVATAFNLALSGYVTPTNGDAILSYAIASGSLPPGLSLDAGTGIISGTPTAGGTYNVTVTASDNDGASNADAIQFVIAVDGTPPATPNIFINNDDTYTNSTAVSVSITGDTDNVGVTGWFVSESASVPVLGSFGPKPSTANISAVDGTKTLHAWTRDAAGNISLVGSDTIILDTTPPAAPTGLALDGGVASTTAGSVALSGLTTPADADLAAWFVSESASAPAAGAAGWSSTKPTTYSFASATNETKFVCVYVKDTANNVQGTGACDTIDKVP